MAQADAAVLDGAPEPDEPKGPLEKLASMPVARQVSVFVALAASIAIGFWVVLWSQEADYEILFTQVDEQEITEIISELDTALIQYKLNVATGAVQVEAGELNRARLLLASKGLPRTAETGFDVLEKDDGFGISQFRERARYNRAMEGELAQSIASIRSVRSARVHLALPKQSVFVRKRVPPSASVVVDLYAGRVLEKGQVAAIVHMVASSIPNLESKQVTVIDQAGRLLTGQDDSNMALSTNQLDFMRNVEQNYVERIQNILGPMMGIDSVRAQVSAKVDFTSVEETLEDYTPEQGAIRSEQLSDERSGALGAMGVPGAMTNNAEALDDEGSSSIEGFNNSRKTRNYELDRLLRHSKKAPGVLQSLSIAVVVDEPFEKVTQQPAAAEGDTPPAEGEEAAAPVVAEPVRRPLTDAEMETIRALVKDAVGFDPARGDTLTVTSAPFQITKIEALPELPIWEQPWFMALAKQGVAALIVLSLIFFVLRPMVGSLVEKPEPEAETEGGEELSVEEQVEQAIRERDEILDGTMPPSYEDRLQAAQEIVQNNNELATVVLKSWTSGPGEEEEV
ncbi:MAG: flagellar M-ring protein FliF [Gammaproteobacteria bacterium]|jgi:flagellar M-ring protein FliF|nr:flagellar M-ring protein FliF [Gammaproteobacteria bacterium]MBT3490608.1 flagellar M-ring protein FliF [Gammaproteobacteria bacterium]MBT3718040.1 flagellar M-ring protein FliF [Gammaproteobacteria bacterium]MBT3844875.1 flagellar M-ring protein FliF [Gammaproteobacteria bacterium]MBT3891984.1 flagellar M-ring protein FliF [Gammaproteobacteria bacterium]